MRVWHIYDSMQLHLAWSVAQPGCHQSRHNDEIVKNCKCDRSSGSIAGIMILPIFRLSLRFERQVAVLLGSRETAKKQQEQEFIVVSRYTNRSHSKKRVAKCRASFRRPGRRHDILHNLTKMERTQWWWHISQAHLSMFIPHRFLLQCATIHSCITQFKDIPHLPTLFPDWWKSLHYRLHRNSVQRFKVHCL